MVDITIRKEGSSDSQRMKAASSYVLGFITGIAVLLIAGRSDYVRFHALQSIISSLVIGGIVSLLIVYLFQGDILIEALTLWLFILFIYLWYGAYLTYHGIRFRIPVLAGLIQKCIVE